VSLSVKKVSNQGLKGFSVGEIDLKNEIFLHPDGRQQIFVVEDGSIFLFLKGLQMERIRISTPNEKTIEDWHNRIAGYQSIFIEDPDEFVCKEYEWNAFEDSLSEPVIECFFNERAVKRRLTGTPLSSVPLLVGPMRLDSKDLEAFLFEIENQRPEDTLLRMQAILKEYQAVKKDSLTENAQFIYEIFILALEHHQIEKALQIWTDYIDHQPLSLLQYKRILFAMEPKAESREAWLHFFESIKKEQWLQLLGELKDTPTEQRLLKILSYKAQKSPEDFIQISVECPPNVQKHILQWVSSRWKPHHTKFIQRALEYSMANPLHASLIPAWILAYMRSAPQEAFEYFERHFKQKRFFWKTPSGTTPAQRILLEVIKENKTIESMEFLKKIRPLCSGIIQDQIASILERRVR